jgi:hypothetical protein
MMHALDWPLLLAWTLAMSSCFNTITSFPSAAFLRTLVNYQRLTPKRQRSCALSLLVLHHH